MKGDFTNGCNQELVANAFVEPSKTKRLPPLPSYNQGKGKEECNGQSNLRLCWAKPRGNGICIFVTALSNQPLSASDIRNKLRWVAGLDTPITPHTLRHCTATYLTTKNVPQHTIVSILGHADLRSTMRYQHLAADHLRGAMKQL
ncbi:tyrosine-type recombinase/integrase [Sporosarcina sp. FSL K6-3457]|uniref:tyrosine-type recombinase/integrase n=1 Tax=Sporosarcina sp. FSL K6-3457 TaxID=2978204 RepID=UPI0030FC7109